MFHSFAVGWWIGSGAGSLYRASMRWGGRLYGNMVGLMLVGGVGAARICLCTYMYGCGEMSL